MKRVHHKWMLLPTLVNFWDLAEDVNHNIRDLLNYCKYSKQTNIPMMTINFCFMKKGSIVVGDGIVFMSQPLHRISEVHWGSNQLNNSRIFLIDNKRYEILNLVELLSRYNSQSINEKYILSVVILDSLSNYYKQFLFLN